MKLNWYLWGVVAAVAIAAVAVEAQGAAGGPMWIGPKASFVLRCSTPSVAPTVRRESDRWASVVVTCGR